MSLDHPLSNARWVGARPECQSPVIIRRFQASDVKSAVLFVTGLGYFEARINGIPVTEDRFLPLVTDYEPRDLMKFAYPLHDTTTHRIYYSRFDVTELIRDGENVLTVQLGNGWYRQTERVAEGLISFGHVLKTIFSLQLNTAAGAVTVDSDGSETWRGSEIVYSQLYIGEVVDSTYPLGFEQGVAILPAPDATLDLQIGTPDRCVRTLTPRHINTIGNRKIYDAGENISGLVRVTTSAPAGSRITLRYAENITSGGDLDMASTGALSYTCTSGRYQIMEDTFICDGSARTFEPKFVWHAFRYFDIAGDYDDLEVLVIHSNCPVTARFDSSSEGLNYLFETFLRTQLDNMHGSIPSDCPHRERLGYTGDGQVCAEAAMMMLDSQEFYRKWIRDILDCQDKTTGHVQHTAPLMGGGGGPGGWGCAIVIVPYQYYKMYGDTAMLETCYEPMRRWVDYLKAHSEKGLVVREEERGWCLGDWCPLEEPILLPEAYVNSCYFIKILQMLENIAPVVNRSDDLAEYATLRESIAASIRRDYFDPETGTYLNNIQGADAYALWAGLAGSDTARDMALRYDKLGHFDTGFLGTDILMEMLCKYGHIDTALKLLESEEPGSYLYMKRCGATTIWENWGRGNSENHPMFGACVRQLFSSILGIGQEDGAAGYRQLRIVPQIPKNLPRASGSLRLPAGETAVAWKKEADKIHFSITTPQDTTATFVYGGNEYPLTETDNNFTFAIE